MKPLISYYGGKQRIARRIVELMADIPHSIYAEPFAGGLSVLYAKEPPTVSNQSDYVEAINDSNEMLISLYRVARYAPDLLAEKLQWTPYSKAELTLANQIYQDVIPSTELDKAWAVFVACHCSFSHKIGAGWKVGRRAQNVAYKWSRVKDRLHQALERLSQVHIDCVDALDFIARWDTNTTLFYCDPPYPGADQGHYGGYTQEDFERLCSALDAAQCSYILSNYDQGDIAPDSAQQRVEINVQCTASGAGRSRGQESAVIDAARTEVLWICDRSPEKAFQRSLNLEAIA